MLSSAGALWNFKKLAIGFVSPGKRLGYRMVGTIHYCYVQAFVIVKNSQEI